MWAFCKCVRRYRNVLFSVVLNNRMPVILIISNWLVRIRGLFLMFDTKNWAFKILFIFDFQLLFIFYIVVRSHCNSNTNVFSCENFHRDPKYFKKITTWFKFSLLNKIDNGKKISLIIKIISDDAIGDWFWDYCGRMLAFRWFWGSCSRLLESNCFWGRIRRRLGTFLTILSETVGNWLVLEEFISDWSRLLGTDYFWRGCRCLLDTKWLWRDCRRLPETVENWLVLGKLMETTGNCWKLIGSGQAFGDGQRLLSLTVSVVKLPETA